MQELPITQQVAQKGLWEKHYYQKKKVCFLSSQEKTNRLLMKDTLIPLDIIFINDKDIVVYMVKNAQPCKSEKCPIYKTTRNASKVLEINGDYPKIRFTRWGSRCVFY